MFLSFTDANPTSNNVQGSCSTVLDRKSISYDTNFTVMLDETFTPAVISGIENLRISRVQIDAREHPIPGTSVSVTRPLNDTSGPVTVVFFHNDLPQLSGGNGYLFAVSFFSSPSLIRTPFCQWWNKKCSNIKWMVWITVVMIIFFMLRLALSLRLKQPQTYLPSLYWYGQIDLYMNFVWCNHPSKGFR